VGKWLLYIDCGWIRPVWDQVVTDVQAGLLGPSAKVSMCKYKSPLATRPGKHVVCIYTRSWRDQADVERVARQLVKTAKLKKMVISYKSDEQTLDGTYQWNADGALYTFRAPYESVVVSSQGLARLGG